MEMHTPMASSGTNPSAVPGRLNIDQTVFDLFDEYVHGFIDRRGFLERASKLAATGATAGMTATALLDALNPRFAEAQQVPRNDKRLHAHSITYESPGGTGQVRGYLARPASEAGKLPAILVVHENRG